MKFRLRAFAIHLAISATIALLSLALVFWVWHPPPLAKAVGVTHIFLLLLAIDATLGPVLTLLVAKPGKKSLKMDLAIIAILQVAAYFYGMFHIAEGRPVWIVYDQVRFQLVSANEVIFESEEISENYRTIPWLSPQWVSVKAPENDEEKNAWLFHELQTGASPAMRPHLYQPLLLAWTQMEAKKKSLAELYEKNDKDHIDAILATHPEADAYLPLAAPEKDMVVLMDSQNEKILKIVDASP